MSDYVVRRATPTDVDFLVEAAIQADMSGGSRSTYSTLFDLSPEAVESTLREVLLTDVEGQELCISGAMVAEAAGRPAAAVTAWIEGHDETPSTIAKASVLFAVLGGERAQAARPRLAALSQLAIPRALGAIQLESIYVRPDHRGRGLVSRLVEAHLADLGARAPAKVAQIMLAGNNERARGAYAKLGFALKSERTSDDPEVGRLLPDNTRILMERSL